MKTKFIFAIVVCMLLIIFSGCSANRASLSLDPSGDSAKSTENVVKDTSASAATATERSVSVPPASKTMGTAEKELSVQSDADDSTTVEGDITLNPTSAVEQSKAPEEQPQKESEPLEKEKTEPTAVTPPKVSTDAQPSKPAPVEEHRHSYKATVIAPTCEASGYTMYACTCGDSYTDNATNPLGHAWEQTGHADATAAAEGWTEYTCSRCGTSYRDTIPKIVQTGASAADAQRVCDEVNGYIRSHYAITQNRGTYMGITWVQSSADVQGAINSTIGTVDLYAQYYGAKSFCCGYLDDGGGSYTIILYWDTI